MRTHQPVKNATLLPLKCVQKEKFAVLDYGVVDTELWYVIQAEPKVARWIREQSRNLWYEHLVGHRRVLDTFNIHEKLHSVLALRWA